MVFSQVDHIAELISSDLTRPFIRMGSKGVPEEIDRRQEAIKSIEVLDKMLKSHYNSKMKEYKEEFDEAYKDLEKEFQDDFNEWFKVAKIDPKKKDKISLFLKYGLYDKSSPLYFIFVDRYLELMEDLFQCLLNLLKDKDYLKGSSYEEDDDLTEIIDVDKK